MWVCVYDTHLFNELKTVVAQRRAHSPLIHIFYLKQLSLGPDMDTQTCFYPSAAPTALHTSNASYLPPHHPRKASKGMKGHPKHSQLLITLEEVHVGC